MTARLLQAIEFIKRGLVEVDGAVEKIGQRVSPKTVPRLLREGKKEQQRKVSVVLNKPVNWVKSLILPSAARRVCRFAFQRGS